MTCMKKDNQKVAAEQDESIYHEKQSRELCALHALNNLFQKAKTFTKKQLDEICCNLSPNTYINPHRSMIGLGNYDVNVIISALLLKGYDTLWFDKRRSISDLDLDRIYGFILNVPSDMKWGMIHLPIQRKHWVTVRKVKDQFYNFDSKIDHPELIGNDDQLVAHLKEQIQNKDKELLLIVSQDHHKDIWTTSADIMSSQSGNMTRTSSNPQRLVHAQSGEFKESGV